jgi:hypothetical protein
MLFWILAALCCMNDDKDEALPLVKPPPLPRDPPGTKPHPSRYTGMDNNCLRVNAKNYLTWEEFCAKL